MFDVLLILSFQEREVWLDRHFFDDLSLVEVDIVFFRIRSVPAVNIGEWLRRAPNCWFVISCCCDGMETKEEEGIIAFQFKITIKATLVECIEACGEALFEERFDIVILEFWVGILWLIIANVDVCLWICLEKVENFFFDASWIGNEFCNECYFFLFHLVFLLR